MVVAVLFAKVPLAPLVGAVNVIELPPTSTGLPNWSSIVAVRRVPNWVLTVAV
jgi:hypothetical protein